MATPGGSSFDQSGVLFSPNYGAYNVCSAVVLLTLSLKCGGYRNMRSGTYHRSCQCMCSLRMGQKYDHMMCTVADAVSYRWIVPLTSRSYPDRCNNR